MQIIVITVILFRKETVELYLQRNRSMTIGVEFDYVILNIIIRPVIFPVNLFVRIKADCETALTLVF